MIVAPIFSKRLLCLISSSFEFDCAYAHLAFACKPAVARLSFQLPAFACVSP